MKKSFTLIELMVVMGIISVLAAILFPVFAAARESARQATCLSNAKQWALGEVQYIQDYDEHFTACRGWSGSPWTLLVQPYIHNSQIGVCPDSPWQAQQNGTDATFVDTAGNAVYGQLEMSDYGFAIDYLCVPCGKDMDGVEVFTGVSLAEVSRPSQTVMEAECQGVNFATAWWLSPVSRAPWGDINQVPNATVDAPVTAAGGLPIWYSPGWGDARASKDYVTWSYDYPGIGGVAPRHRGRATVCFVDTHAKCLSVAQMAVGTNYSPVQIEDQCRVTDQDAYLWSTR